MWEGGRLTENVPRVSEFVVSSGQFCHAFHCLCWCKLVHMLRCWRKSSIKCSDSGPQTVAALFLRTRPTFRAPATRMATRSPPLWSTPSRRPALTSAPSDWTWSSLWSGAPPFTSALTLNAVMTTWEKYPFLCKCCEYWTSLLRWPSRTPPARTHLQYAVTTPAITSTLTTSAALSHPTLPWPSPSPVNCAHKHFILIIVRPQGRVSLDTGRLEWIRSLVGLFTLLRWVVFSITWIIMGTSSHSTSAWMTITTLSPAINTQSASGGTARCVGSPTTRRMTASHSTCHRRRLSLRSGQEPGRLAAPLTSSPSMTDPITRPMGGSVLTLWVMTCPKKIHFRISYLHRHSLGRTPQTRLTISSGDTAVGDWTVTPTPPLTPSSTPQSSPSSSRWTWTGLSRRTTRTEALVSTTGRSSVEKYKYILIHALEEFQLTDDVFDSRLRDHRQERKHWTIAESDCTVSPDSETLIQ